MVHLWGSKDKEGTEISKSVLGEHPIGDIAVVIGDRLDTNLIYLACQMAKGAKRKAHLVHIVEVPRTLPLNAVLNKESERADELLNGAMQIASKVGCEAVAEVVQARDAGPAIVEEAKDHHCSVIFIGFVRGAKNTSHDFSKIVSYVLTNATCRVWLVQDPCPARIVPEKVKEKEQQGAAVS